MAKNKQKLPVEATENADKPKKGVGQSRLKPTSQSSWIIIICASVLLLGVGVYTVVWIANKDNAEKISEEKEDPRFPKEKVVLEQLSIDSLQMKVSKLELSNQYTNAKKLVKFQKYYDKSKQAQLLYATLCANQGNQKEAFQTLVKVEGKFGESGPFAASIAEQALAAGNKNKAIEYYEKAVALTKRNASNPVRESEAKYYQEKLKHLEGN